MLHPVLACFNLKKVDIHVFSICDQTFRKGTSLPPSLLYHGYGIQGYKYIRTYFRNGEIIFKIAHDRFSLRCPICRSRKFSLKGNYTRLIRLLPIGSKPVFIELPIQRTHCHQCNTIRQITIKFADERRTYSRAFERANGGTLFLDEIGELPHMAQVKLLRVLQTGEFERVGGKRTLFSDVRIIAATHRYLDKMITDGGFRQDLLYRLNVFPINIPPLRERRQDIETLVDYFIRKNCEEMNLSHRPSLAMGALEILRAYNWPGNVRELQNIIERSLILSKGGPLHFMGLNTRPASSVNHNSDPLRPIIQLDKTITRQTQLALEHTWGKISGPDGAAELLGLHPNTLRSKMKKLGINARKNNA